MKNTIKLKGRFRLSAYKKGKLLRQSDWIENLIVLSENYGLNLILQALNGQSDYSLTITTAEIGTGDTPPSDTDTELENKTETIGDIIVATRNLSTDELSLEFFIPDGQLPEGVYKEFGLKCGTQLFARALISPVWTKSIGEDTTCEYIITITNQ